MVDEPGEVAALGGVHDVVEVDPEEVARPDALLLVALLAHVGQHGADVVADVLDDHLVGRDVLEGEEAPVVDGRLPEGHLLPPELELVERHIRNPECNPLIFNLTEYL